MFEKKKENKRNRTVVKLTSFDSNKREVPHYKLEANSTEKNKGAMMIHYLKGLMGLKEKDLQNYIDDEIKEQQKIKWTRDEKGNIISPYSKKLGNENKSETFK